MQDSNCDAFFKGVKNMEVGVTHFTKKVEDNVECEWLSVSEIFFVLFKVAALFGEPGFDNDKSFVQKMLRENR